MADLDTIIQKLDVLLARDSTIRRFLPVGDAARYAGVSVESIRRMLANGQLTQLRPVPGRVVVDREQLDSAILATAQPRATPTPSCKANH